MTRLEDRLRRDLPDLADALTGTTPPPADGTAPAPAESARSWSAILTVAAAATLLVAGVVAISSLRDPATDDGVGSDERTAVPASFGTWSTMTDAPIPTRPYAVSAWTGDEAVFWAGSSRSRGFAFSDGAAYDPATDTWRKLTVPGWGHPGLSGAYFDGGLYALAKGGDALVVGLD